MAEEKIRFSCPAGLHRDYWAIGEEIRELMEAACPTPKTRENFQGVIGRTALQLLVRATPQERLDALRVILGAQVDVAEGNLRKRERAAKPAGEAASQAEGIGDADAAYKPTARPKQQRKSHRGKTGS
ncbi:unnamed protein product [marine sediment metagenome]|uniref:Uncharacterized protein n=1 Tax=marine sediment metagenome TaxID=412755 RepID=X0UEH8_9ZZZZ